MIILTNPDTNPSPPTAVPSVDKKHSFPPALSFWCSIVARPAFVAALLFSLALPACARKDKDKDESKSPTAEKEKTAEPESRVKHGTNGETIVTLDAATQKLMGLQFSTVPSAQLSPEL